MHTFVHTARVAQQCLHRTVCKWFRRNNGYLILEIWTHVRGLGSHPGSFIRELRQMPNTVSELKVTLEKHGNIIRITKLSRVSITICSDSQAALKAISTAKTTSGLVWENMTKLQSLSIQNCVRLLWNPGHSNIKGNEMADNLANRLLQQTSLIQNLC